MLANVRGRDLVGFVEEAKAGGGANKCRRHRAIRLKWGGQFENQQRAAARLAIVVPLALALIFLLLFLTFGSVRQALLVFCNVPSRPSAAFSAFAFGRIPVGAGVGWLYCPARYRGSERRRDGVLHQRGADQLPQRASKTDCWCATPSSKRLAAAYAP